MKEDLGMHGNELVTAVTIWTVGYVIGQIPVNLLLTRVPPRYVLCGVSLKCRQGLTTARVWLGYRDSRILRCEELPVVICVTLPGRAV
jgi:hypothetical protein